MEDEKETSSKGSVAIVGAGLVSSPYQINYI